MYATKESLWGFAKFDLYWLIEYHRYWIDKAKGEKNPEFTKESGLILSLKAAQNRDHARAVSFFGNALTQEFKRMNPATSIEVVVVPSSTAGQVSTGLVAAVRQACRAVPAFQLRAGALTRVKTIPKLAHGGDRSVAIHSQTINYQPNASLCPVMILDDVCTTGNSLIACHNLITSAHGLRRPAFAFALGRTVND